MRTAEATSSRRASARNDGKSLAVPAKYYGTAPAIQRSLFQADNAASMSNVAQSRPVTEAEARMAEDQQDKDDDLYIVQHAVVIQSGENIHAVNDLLSAGWRVVQTANLTDGALLILETSGTKESIEGLRKTLGYISD
jgi:hypothetical protein